jgi:hypothetical protein
MLRTLRRVFHPAVPDPEGMGAARTAEASRRKERREQGRPAQTMHTRRETATALVSKKLREVFAVKRSPKPKLRMNLLDRGRTGLAPRRVKKRLRPHRRRLAGAPRAVHDTAAVLDAPSLG